MSGIALPPNHHLIQPWWAKVSDAAEAGQGNLYPFGINVIKDDYSAFMANGLDRIPAYHTQYVPNPYMFQYDLMIHIFLNFDDIQKREIRFYQSMKSSSKVDREEIDLKIEEIRSGRLGGLEKKEYLFGAAEIRWPTRRLPSGALEGKFIRDPWCERRIDAVSSDYNYVITFGGGGQGKTHVFLAFMLMMFDHYIYTEKGARCMFSTVNKDKLNGATWPYLQSLNNTSRTETSLYCGRGKIAGDFTLKRPGTRDTAGVYKGILVGVTVSDTNVVDKLTGSHGHPVVAYMIDELQSTPLAPINASTNFTMHARHSWIVASGNYGNDGDSLGKNVIPKNGWKSVDETTGEWTSTMTTGHTALVLHFNNDQSPAMTKEGAILYPHLPNDKIKNAKYPNKSSQTIENTQYRRFWLGWRVEGDGAESILTQSLIDNTGASLDLKLSQVFHKFLAFDSAQADIDRNVLGIILEGTDSDGNHVWGPRDVLRLKKTTHLNYYQKSTDEIYNVALAEGIDSGAMIVDFTGRPAHAELLAAKGFAVRRMVYNQSVPDGHTVNSVTGAVDQAILLDSRSLPFVYAHHKCSTKIALGAFALQQYVINGKVRGLNDNLLAYLKEDNRTLDEELFIRKFDTNIVKKYGDLYVLDSKTKFKKKYGFSPDLLDLLFQSAYYMLVYRGMPLYNDGTQKTYESASSNEENIDDHCAIWNDDLLEGSNNEEEAVSIHFDVSW